MATDSDVPAAGSHLEFRRALISDRTKRGRALARELAAVTDEWLAARAAAAGMPAHGAALVATGGYGRGELCPASDLDLLLLHDADTDIDALADGIWYSVWDAGLPLGHTVATVAEAVAVASDDLETLTAHRDLRLLAGDAALVAELSEGVDALWRSRRDRLLAELVQAAELRHERSGEVAFLLEPDIKDGRGGLRDVHLLGWIDGVLGLLAPVDRDTLRRAEDDLLAVRVALHRHTGRRTDRLVLEDQDEVAAQLGVDADTLVADVAAAARTVSWVGDEVARQVLRLTGHLGSAPSHRDRPVAPGVMLRDGSVHVVADIAADPAVAVRSAAAAARVGANLDRDTLRRLADELPTYDDPWPDDARDRLIDLLGQGPNAIRVLDALDQAGVLTRILPEWEPVRSRPQRNAYHRFTVDRHLHESAVQASRLTDRVERPDLLLVAAWLHDLGKGYPGDHTEVGQELMARIAARMGFEADEVEVLVSLVRHHLLLPDTATRRDIADSRTIAAVAETVGDRATLALLWALTEADSLATGPAAWGPWKEDLVASLVDRVDRALVGDDLALEGFPSAEHRSLLEAGDHLIEWRGDQLVVVADDRPGLFSRIAGALALRGLDVLEGNAHSDEGTALSVVRVSGPEPADRDRVVTEVGEAIAGRLALAARVAQRARLYASRPQSAHPARLSIEVRAEASNQATVVEVRAPNQVGVLFHVTRSFAELDLDIRQAKVQTLGHEVVDAFYLTDSRGEPLDERHVEELVRAVRHAVEHDLPS